MNFRNKYRRDNDLLRAPQPMPESIVSAAEKGGTAVRPVTRVAAAAVAACVLLTAAIALPALSHRGRDLPLVQTVSTGDLEAPADYSEIYRTICDLSSYNQGYGVLTDGAIYNDSVIFSEERAESFFAEGEIAVTAPTMKETNSVADDFLADSASGESLKSSYSATNTQKENVDEADLIKTDGRYIYRLTGQDIVIIDPFDMSVVSTVSPDLGTDDAEESKLLTGTTSVNGAMIDIAYPHYGGNHIVNIYVSGDRMAVLYSGYMACKRTDGYADTASCGVMVYDITDRAAPVLLGDCSQSGNLLDSRLIGDFIYIVSNHYVYSFGTEDQPDTYMPLVETNGESCVLLPEDVCLLPDASAPSFSVIASVDLRSGSRHQDVKAAFGCSGTVYADTEQVILCFPKYESTTEDTVVDGKNLNLSKGSDSTLLVSYAISEGSVSQIASGSVPGSMLNQFSIDRHNGVVRIVTTLNSWEQRIWTDGVDRHEYESSTTNGLYTLDAAMNIIGSLDGLAEEERVYSVRFQGDIGYFVTFRQVDPLYAVDLSDPASPAILSALKIPGFSQYMHPYASGLMLGFGMDADEKTGSTNGMKLSMFDISDPADVTERHKLLFPDLWWSEALSNHKAMVVSAERDIIAFPIDNGYIICGYSTADGFCERYRLKLDEWSSGTRGLYIDDNFYICTETTLYRYDMDGFEKTAELKFAERSDMGYILID